MMTSLHSHSRRNFLTGTPYITEEAAQGLKKYRYAGGDNGIMYRWFFNPVAIKLVSFLPEYIA
jgi:hypothetical protein